MINKEANLIVGYYKRLEDMKAFINSLVISDLVYDVEGQFIHLRTGDTVIMFNHNDSFHAIRGFKVKTIVLINGNNIEYTKKEIRRIERVSSLIWNEEKDFLISQYQILDNRLVLEEIIKEIEEEKPL